MQTFLPHPDFLQTAQCLDYRRLGKQRVEAMQILNALEGKSSGWIHHPAVKMWAGYTRALQHYCNIMIGEWIYRGYRNTMLYYPLNIFNHIEMPPWLGDEKVHSTHRANLIRKDPVFYGKYGWTEEPLDGYYWPTGK